MQALGGRIAALSDKDLTIFVARVELDETLLAAIRETRRLPPRSEAMRRQLQFVGKLMRNFEPEPIESALDHVTSGAPAAELQREAELWRDRLLSEGDAALQALIETHPTAERQKMRQLVRRAAKAASDTPAHSQGELELVAELRRVLSPGR